MGLGLGDLKRWLDLGGALKKIADAKRKGRATFIGILTGVLGVFFAKVFVTCPDLLAQAPAIICAGVAAVIAYYTKTAAGGAIRKMGKAGLAAACGSGWVALCVQFKATCPALVDNWPLIAMAALTTFAAQLMTAPSQKE